MEPEDVIPGVTFYFESSSLSERADKTIAEVRLTAHVTDLDLWEQVKLKLDGLKISSVDSLQSEITEAIRDEYDKARSRLEDLERQSRQTSLELLQKIDLLQADNTHLRSSLSLKEAENTVLREALEKLRGAI